MPGGDPTTYNSLFWWLQPPRCPPGRRQWSFGELNYSDRICYSLELTVPLPHPGSPVGTHPQCVGLHSCTRGPCPLPSGGFPNGGHCQVGGRGGGSGHLCVSAGGQAPVKVALHRTPSPEPWAPGWSQLHCQQRGWSPCPMSQACFQ